MANQRDFRVANMTTLIDATTGQIIDNWQPAATWQPVTRPNWQPCGVCGLPTDLYSQFVPERGMIAVWPLCSEMCHLAAPERYHDLKTMRNRGMNYGVY